jgi:hypothetical protein
VDVSVAGGAVAEGAEVTVGGAVGCAAFSSGAGSAAVSLAAADLVVGVVVVHAAIKTTPTIRTRVFETVFSLCVLLLWSWKT